MKDCIFCKIPAEGKEKLLFKDSKCYVIYDKYPAGKGHMLVISRKHYKNFLEAPDTLNAHLFSVAKKFAKLAIKEFKATGINLVVNNGKDANQAIMHVHVHVLPRYPSKAGKPHHKIAGAEKLRRHTG